jgi:hypothetical protein
MPRATERVYKEHTERMGQIICPSVPKILPKYLHPASKNKDILPRRVLPSGQYSSSLMSICCKLFNHIKINLFIVFLAIIS